MIVNMKNCSNASRQFIIYIFNSLLKHTCLGLVSNGFNISLTNTMLPSNWRRRLGTFTNVMKRWVQTFVSLFKSSYRRCSWCGKTPEYLLWGFDCNKGNLTIHNKQQVMSKPLPVDFVAAVTNTLWLIKKQKWRLYIKKGKNNCSENVR